ncbi:MAG: hypothetical protein WKF82_01065 [Nocardioidaceae bacterium]
MHHESDHLEGIVFGDRLATRARKKLAKEAAKVAPDYAPGWPAPGEVNPGENAAEERRTRRMRQQRR